MNRVSSVILRFRAPVLSFFLAATFLSTSAAQDTFALVPGAKIWYGKYPGYETVLHTHPGEGFTPCMVITNDTDEIHAFIDKRKYDWIISLVYIMRGKFSPIGDLKVGDPLSKVKRVLQQGKLVRQASELADPVSYRATDGERRFDVVEYTKTSNEQGGDWNTFDVSKIPESAKVLYIVWY